MKILLALILLLPLNAFAQQTDPTSEEFAAAVDLTTRYLQAIRRTQNIELKELEDLIRMMNDHAANTNRRLDALEAAQKAAPSLRVQSINVAVPATP